MILKGKVAIVTGAGQGIGYGIAETIGREGATVIVGEVVEERGRAAAAKLEGKGYRAQAIPLDVAKPESCAALVKQVMGDHGQIDILVNNAGIFIFHKSEDIPPSDWNLQMDVMLNGVFFMTQAAARVMIPQRRGSIVNIASVVGMGGWPVRLPYNAAKAGVIVLTEALASEWGQHNIRVNCVSPGPTLTEMFQEGIKAGLADLQKYCDRIPLGRVAEVQEISNVVLFLASDRASFVTGQNLRVDGGWIPWANLNCRGFPEVPPRG